MDFHALNPNLRNINPNNDCKTKPIAIRKNVFIGGFSIILKGVSIEDGSIIGAGSVVSGEIHQNKIRTGNPARFMKKVEKK